VRLCSLEMSSPIPHMTMERSRTESSSRDHPAGRIRLPIRSYAYADTDRDKDKSNHEFPDHGSFFWYRFNKAITLKPIAITPMTDAYGDAEAKEVAAMGCPPLREVTNADDD
jgi:hypothetical protein